MEPTKPRRISVVVEEWVSSIFHFSRESPHFEKTTQDTMLTISSNVSKQTYVALTAVSNFQQVVKVPREAHRNALLPLFSGQMAAAFKEQKPVTIRSYGKSLLVTGGCYKWEAYSVTCSMSPCFVNWLLGQLNHMTCRPLSATILAPSCCAPQTWWVRARG